MVETDVSNKRIDKPLPPPFTRLKVEERENSDLGWGPERQINPLKTNRICVI